MTTSSGQHAYFQFKILVTRCLWVDFRPKSLGANENKRSSKFLESLGELDLVLEGHIQEVS